MPYVDSEREHRISFRVNRPEQERLERVAERHGVPVSEVIRSGLGFDSGEVKFWRDDLPERPMRTSSMSDVAVEAREAESYIQT
jgi:hypothetical protein